MTTIQFRTDASDPVVAGVDRAIALLCCGPVNHGVTRLARQIAGAALEVGFGGAVLSETDPTRVGELVDRLPPQVRLVHMHVNDWLFADPHSTADLRISAMVLRLRRRGIALSVTLHDLPQLSDGTQLFRRRANTYRTIVGFADTVVVSSQHERALLQEVLAEGITDADEPAAGSTRRCDSPGREIEIIPLPIDAEAVAETALDPASSGPAGSRVVNPARPPTIGIFGYLYPGKGHLEVLQALSGMRPAVKVVAIGRPSDRHAALLPDLRAVAERGGIEFRCTGYVPDAEVVQRLRDVLVPLAPHTHVSASGSINSWIAAGRRPLVPAGRYVTELDRRLPGSVLIFQPGRLREAVERAISDPESTWLPADFTTGPTTADVASSYLALLRHRVAAVRP